MNPAKDGTLFQIQRRTGLGACIVARNGKTCPVIYDRVAQPQTLCVRRQIQGTEDAALDVDLQPLKSLLR